jgi:hypothetical protein
MAWASDTTVWARMRDGEGLNFELGVPNGDTLAAWGSWQDYADKPNIPSSIFSSLNQGKMSVNLNKKIGVVAGILRSYIDILDLNSGEKLQILGPELDYPKYTIDYSQGYPMPSIEENKEYYLKNFPGEEAIFLLYAGFSYNLFGNPPRNPRIFLMDYEGKIFKVYELDHVITSMHIDEESKKIYGITVDAEPNVVVFDY